MNRLGQFWHYVTKVFALPARLRALRDERSQPVIPTRVFSASLLLGAVLRVPSFLQLQAETARRGWQRLVGWRQPVSDDAFGYVLERYRAGDWRAVLVAVNRTLKTNKAFEPAKINGLLVVALDANEQFKSQHRCCPACCQRRLEVKDAASQPQTVTEYYHRQVYAQIHGPDFSVILDVEPLRPGEDEAAAALRLLGRMRRSYGQRVARNSQWRWLVSRELDPVDAPVIWRIGHQRWGVENHAFNELTQHYHLTHCPRHAAAAIQTWLLILVLGFNLFELFVRRHGKLWRQGRTTLQESARQLDRALEAVPELRPLWSG